jgi:beta-glucuronidase
MHIGLKVKYNLGIFQVHLRTYASSDIYRHPFGIRKLHWNATSFLINNKPLYLRGFGKHEDYDVIGRGLDASVLIRDMNLMAWLGANSFRTSHYPYSEEQMDLVDRHGYMVIMEAPACTIK